jgi:mannosyltransferase OCH1-like enzyme
MQISSVFLGAQPLPAQAIPRIIHQTFRSADLPERIGQASQSWISRNPEYDYRFHDDAACRDLIAQHFDADVLTAYDRLENGAFRADLWRYCQLYLTGGVYADIDTICRMPLSGLLRPEDRFVSARAGNLPHAIYNGFICAAPAHPFLKAAIERAVRQVLRRRGRIDGYMATGPWNLGAAVNRSLGRAEKTHHLHGLTRSGQHDLRLLRKHPKTAGQSGFLSWEGKTVLLTEYPEYRQDLVASGLQHWQTTLPGKPPGLARSWLRKLRQLRL